MLTLVFCSGAVLPVGVGYVSVQLVLVLLQKVLKVVKLVLTLVFWFFS